MASSADQNAGGPRYAPDDPTLPTPWKGLIDGASGVLYYWNPDTNLTQYEKPPIITSSSSSSQQPQAAAAGGEQSSQMYQQSTTTTSSSYQTPQQMTQVVVSQQNNHPVSVQYPQQQQQQQPLGMIMPNHHHQQYTQQGQQQMQYYQGGVGLPPPHQQQRGGPYMMGGYHYQPLNNNNNNSYPPPQGGQPPPPQEQQQQHREETQGKKKTGGFSPSQGGGGGGQYSAAAGGVPPSSSSSYQNQPPSSVQMQHQQMTSSSGQSPSPLSQNRNNDQQQQQQVPPRFQNQFDPGMMLRVQQPHASPVNHPNLSHDNSNLPRRSAANDHYFAPPPHTNNGPGMPPQQQQPQPKLATIPMAKNPQDMRFSGAPVQNATPGFASGPNSGPVQGLHNVYGPLAGVPSFANSSMMRPSLVGMDSTAGMNISQTDMYRQKHEVTVTGGDIPAPFMSFDDTGFPPELLNELRLAGFASPTPIQAQTWPIALQNRDIVAIAKTGSGKTLGYLVPAFMLLRHRRNNPRNGPTVLVLSPTRELATQIQLEAIKFGQSSRVSCTCLYGGASKAMQLRELEQGADIVVATPGRLNDILESRQIDLRQVSLLVLDEADRMLDMGFEPQIRKVVNEIPPRRQTLMYTATWPKEVIKIANDLLVNPVQVNIGNVDELAANKSITQIIEMVPHMQKQRRLEQILDNQERGSKVIIFCSTKRLCDQITRTIERRGAAAIHGDKSQGERDYVLNQFRSGKSPILVATDVAARGLDIKDIRVVINYDFPTGVEDYVHRIGRTGRAGATGVAYTFFSDQDWKHAPELIKVLEGANQKVPPEIRELATRGGPSFGRDRDGPNRFESGGGRWDSGGRGGAGDGGFGGRGGMRDGGFGGRGDGGFGGRGGMRDGGFGGRNGMRDGGFGGRGSGMRDGGFGGRDGSRDGGFGGRGGGMRDGGFRGRGGGRDGGFVSRGGGRDGGFGGRGGMRDGGFGGRGDRDRYNNMDSRGGRGRGGGGRFDSRRDVSSRSRGRSFSPSPERVRTWGRDRSRSRSRSWSRSRSRSRSWSRSRSPRRSYSRSRSRSRSFERPRRVRQSKFDQMEPSLPGFGAPPPQAAPVQPSGDGVLSNTQFTPRVDNVEAVGQSEAIATVLSVDPAPET